MRRHALISLGLLSLLLPPACTTAEHDSPRPPVESDLLTEAPVAWLDPLDGERLPLPRHEAACTPDPGAKAPLLAVTVLDAAWTIHPLPKQERFWAPMATLGICNVGTPMTEPLPLELTFGGYATLDRPNHFMVPALKPGEGLGPVRTFSANGVTEAIGLLWSQEGERWPELVLTVASPALSEPTSMKVKREMAAGAGERAVPGKEPATPDLTAGTLPFVAWSQVTFGDPAVTVSLYAPQARYIVQDAPYCGAEVGAVNAGASDWTLYITKAGGTPEKALSIGERWFDGRRGIAKAEVRAELDITFLPVGQYVSCSAPYWYEMYAFDHQTGELYRPLMEDDAGKLRPATASQYTLEPDGALVSKYYVNAGEDGGHNTVTYRWDGPARTWRLVSHTRE